MHPLAHPTKDPGAPRRTFQQFTAPNTAPARSDNLPHYSNTIPTPSNNLINPFTKVYVPYGEQKQKADALKRTSQNIIENE